MRDVLKKQKIKQRIRLFRILLIFACLLFGIVAYLLIPKEQHTSVWGVEILSLDKHAIPPALDKFIRSTAQNNLEHGSHLHLQDTAYVLQEHPQLATVRLLKTQADRVVVFAEVRRPHLVIWANKMHMYISSKGDVFGAWDNNLPLPKFSGALNKNRRYQISDKDTLILSLEEKKTIQQALDIQALATKYKFTLKRIVFEKYRGFRLEMDKLSVFLGQAPFAKKFAKMEDIIASAQAKNTQIGRIELDYKGKAFVKKTKEL